MAEPRGEGASDPAWAPAEKWAWQEIAGGRIADFNSRFGALDPATDKGWAHERTLSGAFLRTILSREPWAGRLPIEGVRIEGARWCDRLVLPHARLNRSLSLEACRFERPVDLGSLHLDGLLSLRNSAFEGADDEPSLILDGAAAWRVDLAGGLFRKDLSAAGTACAGVMNLNGARLEGKLDLERARIGCFFLRNATARRIVMSRCEVEQDIDLSGSESGELAMAGLRAGGDLLLGGSETRPARFEGEVNLIGAIVGGELTLTGATVTGEVKMNGIEVKTHLWMRAPYEEEQNEKKGATVFRAKVDAAFAEIGGYLQLQGAEFDGPVEMVGIQIGKALTGPGDDARPTVFRDQFSLRSARIQGWLNLNGRTLFEKDLILRDAQIDGGLFLAQADRATPEVKGKLVLAHARVGDQMVLTALCHGPLDCNSLKVGANFFMCGAEPGQPDSAARFKDKVELDFAEIGGMADLNDAAFEAGLSLNNVQVGRDLRLNASLRGELVIANGKIGGDLTIKTMSERKLDLRSVRVGQDLYVTGRPIDGEIDMRDMQIERDLRLSGVFAAPVQLSQARVGRVFESSAAWFSRSLDLSASTVAGQICLHVPSSRVEYPEPEDPEIRLDLRDAKAGSLQLIDPTGWPAQGSVQLDGFTYDRLGGSGVDGGQEMIERRTD